MLDWYIEFYFSHINIDSHSFVKSFSSFTTWESLLINLSSLLTLTYSLTTFSFPYPAPAGLPTFSIPKIPDSLLVEAALNFLILSILFLLVVG